MRFELPHCRRCCLCVPLRYGIITFGYLHLAFDLFILTIWIMRLKRRGLSGLTTETISVYKGVVMRTEMWLTALLYILDVIFNVVLLIGAHMKRVTFIRVYYYYGITTSVASLVSLLLIYSEFDILELAIAEYCLAFSAFVLQVYLLLLIRSEMMKVRYQEGCISYYNSTSEVIEHPPMWTDRT